MLREIGESLSRLIFTPRCYVCDQEITELSDQQRLKNRFFCPDCWQALIISPWKGCNFCGAYRTEGRANAKYCSHCRGKQLHFDKVITLGIYDGLMRECMLMIKKPENFQLAAALAEALFYARNQELKSLNCDWVVPVPMNPYHKKERKINDAEVIAARLAELLRVPYQSALIRIAATEPQKGLNPRQRHENVFEAFQWDWWVEKMDIPKTVLLVDDILTTGSTCSEIARYMKSWGVEKVYAAVLARAVGQQDL